jgi:hypothetical protein
MDRIEFPANCPPVPEEQLTLSEPEVSVNLLKQTATICLCFREKASEYQGTGKDRKMVPVVGAFRYILTVRPTSGRKTAAWFDGPRASDPDSWGMGAAVESYTVRYGKSEPEWCEEKDSLTGHRGSRTKIYAKAKTIAMREAREAVEASVRSETPQILTLAMLATARENVRRCATKLRDDLTEELLDTERHLYSYSFERTQQLCTELSEAQAAAASLAALVARLGYAAREDD